MRTLRFPRGDPDSSRPEARRPQRERPKGTAELGAQDGCPQAQNVGGLPAMPRRYPCRETDTETDSERQHRSTGEPDTWKACKSGSEGGCDTKLRMDLL